MTAVIAIAGEGELAELIGERLAERWAESSIVHMADAADVPEGTALILKADEEPEQTDPYEQEERMRRLGMPWLRVGLSRRAGEAVIGPLVRPDRPGCSWCAEVRLRTAEAGRQPIGPLPEAALPDTDRPSPARLHIARRHVAALAAAEALRLLGGQPPHAEEHLHLVRLRTLASSRHPLVPDPLCPFCGALTKGPPNPADFKLAPAPKYRPDRDRVHPASYWRDKLRRFYDARTGMINARYPDLHAPFASVSVGLPVFGGSGELAGGRALTYADGETAALLEGLERRCGQAPLGRGPVAQGSFRELAGEALDPRRTGLYAKAQYAMPDFPCEPFDPDEPIEWVRGFSLTKNRPLLVPLGLVYHSSFVGENWVSEGSSGSAIGGSLEEAVLHAVLELIERDAFLLTWHARLPLPELDPSSAGDPELTLMLARIRAVSGYEVRLYDMTMDSGVPSVLALAKTRRPGRMNLVCGAGARFDPVQAAKAAVHEAAGLMEGLQEPFAAEREFLERMYRQPTMELRMEHHALLYGLPQAEERLAFLTEGDRPPRTFAEAFVSPPARQPDVAEDVRALLQTFRRLGLEVIAVDQTKAEIARIGLRCVKAIIPGLLPMTFGYAQHRLEGLERALRLPAELGYAAGPLTVESLNVHPHPFP